MSYYYCWNCKDIQFEDELGTQRELMDPGVPGSWMSYTVCGSCGTDEIQEITAEDFRAEIEDIKDYILNNDTPPWAKASVRFIDVALEYLYE